MIHSELELKLAKPGTGTLVDFSGTWTNEIESTMQISQAIGQLSGTYVSKKSATGESAAGDLLGYVDGGLISVVVHWRDFQAITS